MNEINGISPLIDRLKKCSEIKYPNRKWTEKFYLVTVDLWKHKELELLERVLFLEKELNTNNEI